MELHISLIKELHISLLAKNQLNEAPVSKLIYKPYKILKLVLREADFSQKSFLSAKVVTTFAPKIFNLIYLLIPCQP